MGLLADDPQYRRVGGVEQRLRLLDARRVDEVLGVHDTAAGALLGGDHAVGARHSVVERHAPLVGALSRPERAGERLFDDDVLAGPEHRDREFLVEPVGHAGVDEVDPGIGQQRVEVRVGLVDAVSVGEVSRGFGSAAVHPNDLDVDPVHPPVRVGVKVGREPAAYDRDSHAPGSIAHLLPPYEWLSPKVSTYSRGRPTSPPVGAAKPVAGHRLRLRRVAPVNP